MALLQPSSLEHGFCLGASIDLPAPFNKPKAIRLIRSLLLTVEGPNKRRLAVLPSRTSTLQLVILTGRVSDIAPQIRRRGTAAAGNQVVNCSAVIRSPGGDAPLWALLCHRGGAKQARQ